MLSITFALLLTFLGAGLVSLAAGRALGPSTMPVAFLLSASSVAGLLNNLYDRHPLVQAMRFAVLGGVIGAWLIVRRRGGPQPQQPPRPLDRAVMTFFAFYALQAFNPHWSSLRAGLGN